MACRVSEEDSVYLRGAAGCLLSSSVCGGFLCAVVLHHFPEASPICRLSECIIIFYVGHENHNEVALLKRICVLTSVCMYSMLKKYAATILY